ncbi:hypothetical protein N7462_006191 [Penicillium macrosclerotiorum]|uniref:uncharacterized protein n=1 Tax=Penicillium macrosclerotiorum TaxID=303699 RepID=UPI0025490987|nr:uncharacterized protein N7462_006191 [Penicillium macrosclerotiorum]KAJ5683026.1 hypothetical protein N7462_006191 [Penicillium macrosclerotiorum]
MDAAVLQCTICPGQPRFSDLSHLLTHVASKAHLSYYFKLQVRSHQEVAAAELLEEYDHWFIVNDLSRLLSERISSKEDRRKKRKSQVKSTVSSNVQRTPRTSIGVDSTESNSHATSLLPDFLDPRLVGSFKDAKPEVTAEDLPFLTCYVTPAASAATDAHSISNAVFEFDPAQSLTNGITGGWYETAMPKSRDSINPALPVTPKPLRFRSRSDGLPLLYNEATYLFSDGKARMDIQDDREVDKDRAEEMARLKGVLWPGMDIFDSATQQMRRKRNQKKDGNVLRRMEMTSLLVEPTELIFSPTGTLRKQRMISGNVEDDSPLKGETPIPKRRPPRPKRGVLRQKDANIPRASDRKRAKRAAAENRNRSENASGSPGNPLSLKGFGSTYIGDDDDLNLSMRVFDKRSRNGFTIFTDDNQNKRDMKNQRARPKVSRDTLTPARLVLNHKPDISNHHITKHHHSSLDKENIEHMMTSHGRISPPSWNSPFIKRSDSDTAEYAPRYFFDEPSNVGLGLQDDQNKCGYRSNPLLAPASKMNFYSNSSYDDVAITSSGWTSISRAGSSEETLSEEDHHELARLYLEATAAE